MARKLRQPFGRTRKRVLGTSVIPPFEEVATTTVKGTSPSKVATTFRTGMSFDTMEVMSDVVTPGYRSLVSDGFFINNNMSKNTTLQSSATGSWITESDFFYPGGSWTRMNWVRTGFDALYDVGIFFPWFTRPVATLAPIDLNASAALNRAFSDARSSLSMVLVEIAEAQKTLLLLVKLQQELIHAVANAPSHTMAEMRKLQRQGRKVFTRPGKTSPRSSRKSARSGSKSRTWTAARKGAKAAADRWMEWRYGVMPLVYSVQDAREALAELLERSHRVTGRGTDNDERESSLTWSSSPQYITPGDPQSAYYTITDKHVRKVTGTLRAGVCLEVQLSANHILGTDLNSVPASVYELVPYSWMVDWVVGIGDWLSGVIPLPGEKFLGSWVSQEISEIDSRTFTLTGCTWDYVNASQVRCVGSIQGFTCQGSVVSLQKNRVVNLDHPFLPSYLGFRKAARDFKHLLDTAAVGFHAFGGRRS